MNEKNEGRPLAQGPSQPAWRDSGTRVASFVARSEGSGPVEGRGRSRAGPGARREEGDRAGGERGARGRFPPRRKVCYFCVNRIDAIDYKQADFLRQYVTDRARIKARRKSGVCARHQRRLAKAIKRARHLALLPSSARHARGI